MQLLTARSYPYPANPATIPIETDYLLDVASAESMVSAMHATAVQAQAIAARTYTYWHIQRGSINNNSNEFQVFVPYAFERLNPAGRPDNAAEPFASANLHPYQRKVCAAVAPRWYVTTAATDLPIHAEFFADIPMRTLSGAPSYLQAVDDPISSHPDVTLNGHGRGMSQRGSGRWVRGNRSFHLERDLGAWSVTWTRVEQLIVHYYTGVQLRDAAAGNTPLLPAARWNPLQIDWGTSDQRPPILWRGQRYPISVKCKIPVWSRGYAVPQTSVIPFAIVDRNPATACLPVAVQPPYAAHYWGIHHRWEDWSSRTSRTGVQERIHYGLMCMSCLCMATIG